APGACSTNSTSAASQLRIIPRWSTITPVHPLRAGGVATAEIIQGVWLIVGAEAVVWELGGREISVGVQSEGETLQSGDGGGACRAGVADTGWTSRRDPYHAAGRWARQVL